MFHWLIRAFRGTAQRRLHRKIETLQSELAEQESENEALRRELRVQAAEIETMAAVIARDRERIRAEGAAYARQRAEQEGMSDERRPDRSVQ